MWDTLGLPWQVALEMAWEAYCSGTIPIGAVIADADGNIITRSRNRVMDSTAPYNQVCSNELAHAELNALLSLTLDREACRHLALYTTMEPCPLCMGALYMSDVKTAHFAARDPWAGSSNLLGATPYLSRKTFDMYSPSNQILEDALIALITEYELFKRGEEILDSVLFAEFRTVLQGPVEKGLALHRSGELRRLQKEGQGAEQSFNWLFNQVQ